MTLTQPSQVEAIRAHFFGEGEVPETFLPLPKDWSPELSRQAARSDVKSYMQDIGTVGYMRLTMPESNTYSLLSSQSKNPSVEDSRAVRNFAAFIITRKTVGITFYPSATHADINVSTQFHCFTDASPGDNLDGAAQISWLIKMGPRGHSGGAIVMKNVKQPGVVADSVPAAEMGAYQHGAKDIVWCRHLAEEFANLVPSGCTDLVVAKSAPPTDTFIDNLSIQSLVSGENGKGKALRSYNRVISHLRSLKRELLTNPLGILRWTS